MIEISQLADKYWSKSNLGFKKFKTGVNFYMAKYIEKRLNMKSLGLKQYINKQL